MRDRDLAQAERLIVLNERNVPTARGGRWTHVQVGAVLRPFADGAASVGVVGESRRAVGGLRRIDQAGR
jgi:hypothetical protein